VLVTVVTDRIFIAAYTYEFLVLLHLIHHNYRFKVGLIAYEGEVVIVVCSNLLLHHQKTRSLQKIRIIG
jgi:hypothetical protein